MSLLALPKLLETQFEEYELIIEQRLGFKMNVPQRKILRGLASVDDTETNSNVMIQAAPGAGKTTLIVMVTLLIEFMYSIGAISEYPKVLALAHMRQNRAMLENYLPNWVEKSTVHALGWNLLRSSNNYTVSKWKTENITHAILKELYPMGVFFLEEDGRRYRQDVSEFYWEIASFIKILVTSLVYHNNSKGIKYLYDIYTPALAGITNEFREELIQKIAPRILEKIEDTREDGGHVSFEEMVTVPIHDQMFNQQYDIVLVDEGQDLSIAQQIVVERVAKYKFLVGDRNQALLRFSGADIDSWHRMAHVLDANIYTMPITQRCPVKVVACLQTLFPEVVPHEDAVLGTIVELATKDEFLKHVNKIGVGIVCRTNADVAEAYVALTVSNITPPIIVLGSDIYKDVVRTISAMRRMTNSGKLDTHNFTRRLQQWLIQELLAVKQIKHQAQQDVRASEIRSSYDTALSLFNHFEPNTINNFISFVGLRFGTEPDAASKKHKLFKESVVVGTAYAWKGLESEHIVVYNTKNYLQHRNDYSQESEVLFVAMSRAKQSLAFYPKMIVTPIAKVSYDAKYVAKINRTMPYPNFDAGLFYEHIQLTKQFVPNELSTLQRLKMLIMTDRH